MTEPMRSSSEATHSSITCSVSESGTVEIGNVFQPGHC